MSERPASAESLPTVRGAFLLRVRTRVYSHTDARTRKGDGATWSSCGVLIASCSIVGYANRHAYRRGIWAHATHNQEAFAESGILSTGASIGLQLDVPSAMPM